jgi:hypothetical protein
VKLHIRKSSIKRRRMHGFREKPYSAKPRGKKKKNLKQMLKARRKRRVHLKGTN